MTLRDYLSRGGLLLSDGAWGTEIAKHGIDPGACPELLNIQQADLIRDLAASYVTAGSDFVLTNTFGGSPQKLARYGLEDRTEELTAAGARLSVEAAAGHAVVLGSVGPTGEFLEPLGLLSETDLIASYARQVRAFAEAGAGGIVVETMSDLSEIRCAITAVRDNSDLPVVCSLTYSKGVKGFATMMGVTPDRAVAEIEAAGADAVGANCGAGIDHMIEVTALMRPSTGLPLWVKPNAGLPELINNVTVYRETPDQMAARVPDLVEAGARIIGGCCGTTPEHIRAFRVIIDRLNSAAS